jgi:hypothetical protein
MFFISFILAYFTLGCSDVTQTPSGVVLRCHAALQSGDTAELKKVMTQEAYLDFLEAALPRFKGSGEVFEHDRKHFRSDPHALSRLETKLPDWLKTRPKGSVSLIAEKAQGEGVREIRLKKNKKEMMIRLVYDKTGWRIARMPKGFRD